MGIKVQNRETYDNIVRFRNSLGHRYGSTHRDGQREYRVLLNCRTGEMSFVKKIDQIEDPLLKKRVGSAKDWKFVQIIVTDGPERAKHFQVLSEGNRELDSFEEKEIDRTAIRIARETVDILNKKAEEVGALSQGKLLEEEALRDLSSLDVLPQAFAIEKISGWVGKMTREEASQHLAKEKDGSFLIRTGDEVTALTVKSLEESNGCTIEYYILMVKENRISEYLILYVNGGWILYKDEPILNSSQYKVFSTPEDLVKSIKQAK